MRLLENCPQRESLICPSLESLTDEGRRISVENDQEGVAHGIRCQPLPYDFRKSFHQKGNTYL